jgi:cellulose synthase/poly-beta-1,6-N-acetylglucosamine synthase-like glycosyltransferase
VNFASDVPEASVSVVIPTFNGHSRIGSCLDALLSQSHRDIQIIVVDDGSTDDTADVIRRYEGVLFLRQNNSGPAAARNRGAAEATGTIILFTDDDCVPVPSWVEAMLQPFADPEVIGVKGAYRTRQRRLVARFVQIEYEDRYRMMSRFQYIDFVDTYSAGFRRDPFLKMTGYDTSFPLACAEDIELSYRMSARGWKMKFSPEAVVYHTHPDSLWRYLRKKYKFAFWRVLALRKNPAKGVRDSHTPQLMKVQLLFLPALIVAMVTDLTLHPAFSAALIVLAAFALTTIPFTLRAMAKDSEVGLLSPLMLAMRSCAQCLGVIAGSVHAWRKASKVPAKAPA